MLPRGPHTSASPVACPRRTRQLLLIAVLAALPFSQARAEVFDWRNINGSSYVTPVRSQGSAGCCWAFSATADLESLYKLTRNDPTYNPNLSEQNLVCVGTMGTAGGGYEYEALDYIASTGIVTETELPYTASNTSSLYPLQPGWTNRVCKATASANWLASDTASIKAELKQYGPLTVSFNADSEWYWPNSTVPISPATPASNINHAVLLVGFHDDASLPGGGYWIVKNSWDTYWGDQGYGYIQYGTIEYHQRIHGLEGPAYFTGSLGSATWQGGGGVWSTLTAKWKKNGVTSAWANGEDDAIFSNAGGSISLGNITSAHTLTINPGATGYSFNGGSLIVTAGGIRASEDATFNTPITVGAPQKWMIASGKTLAFNTAIDTHISSLALTGGGTLLARAAIKDVTTNPSFAGLLTGNSGSLSVAGHTTLVLTGPNGAISAQGGVSLMGGTLVLDNVTDNSSTRLSSNVPVSLGANGEMQFLAHAMGTSQTMGTLKAASGQGAVTLTTHGGVATLIASELSRASGATLLVRGADLGSTTTSQLLFTAAPTLSTSGTGSAVGLIPFILCDTNLVGTGASLTTYDDTHGVRPLDSTEYTSTITAGRNVNLTAAATASAATTLNSLTLGNSGAATTLTLTGSTRLTVTSSAIMSLGTTANTITGGSIVGGANNLTPYELIVYTLADLTVASNIANGSASTLLTKSGAGTLTLTSAAAFYGAANVNAGTLIFKNAAAPGGLFVHSGAVVVDTGGNITIGKASSIGQQTGDAGTLLMKGAGKLTVNAIVGVGDAADTVGQVTLQDSSTLSVKTLYLGRSGNATGTLTQNAGFVGSASSPGDWRIGGGDSFDDSAAQGIYTLAGGTLSMAASFQIGAYGQGTFNQTGGSATFSASPVLGRYSSGVGIANISAGSFTQTGTLTRLIVGQEGSGILNVSGSALLNLSAGLRIGNDDAASGVVNLDGGTLSTPIIETIDGSSTLNFNGGLLKAKAVTTTFLQGLSAANVLAGGAAIDTNGCNITIAQNLLAGSGSTGGLTKSGIGALTLSGTNTFIGAVVINAGSLVAANNSALGAGLASVTVSSGTQFDTGGKALSIAKPFTLSGSGTSATNGAIHQSGSVASTFSGTITLAADTFIKADANSGLVFRGPVSASTAGSQLSLTADAGASIMLYAAVNLGTGGLTKAGDGTLYLNAPAAYTGATTVAAGILDVMLPGHLPHGGNLQLNGGCLKIDTGTGGLLQVGALAMAGAPTGGTINPTAALDLGNNDAIITTGYTVTELRKLLLAGKSGTAGITSSAASAITTLGYMTGGDYTLLCQNSLFDGVTVSSTDLLLKFTYAGDADFSGCVTLDDYAQIDAAFLLHLSNPGWKNGDFNADGLVNYADYALIDTAFQLQTGALAADMIASHTAAFGAPYTQLLSMLTAETVPEPTTLPLLAIGAAILFHARRTHRRR